MKNTFDDADQLLARNVTKEIDPFDLHLYMLLYFFSTHRRRHKIFVYRFYIKLHPMKRPAERGLQKGA
jgi:hypothetical protein